MVAEDARPDGAFGQDGGTSLAAADRAEPAPDASGDDRLEALHQLYLRWSPLVFSVALDRLGGVTEAEEVTRQVFVRAWDAGSPLDADSPQAAPWLVGLARSAVVDMEAAQVVPGPSSAEDQVCGESKPVRLAELLVSDEMSRQGAVREQVLRMALTGHLTSAQIAGRTQLPVDEVKNHLTSSLSSLRDGLAVLDDDAR